MAKILETHDFSRRGNTKYPWSEWEDGQTWSIRHGEDFEVDPRVMQGQIKVRGMKKQLHTATSIDGREVIFTFQRKGESDADFLERTKGK